MSTFGYGYVLPTLAIGSAPPPGTPLRFNGLVLTAMEYQPSPESFPGVDIIYAPLDDANIPIAEIERAQTAGRWAAEYVRRGKRVLVTCYMGWNRSGLVTAFALKDLGHSTEDAVRRIKAVRGEHALSNPWFVDALHRF